jgi:hypothetical protein
MAGESQFTSPNDTFTATENDSFEVQTQSETTNNFATNTQTFESPFSQSGFTSQTYSAEEPINQPVYSQTNEQPAYNPFATETTSTNPFTTEPTQSNPFVSNENVQPTQINPFMNNSSNPFANRPNPFDQQ